jgi:formylglycine-generating enzyme required for sulfatase activity
MATLRKLEVRSDMYARHPVGRNWLLHIIGVASLILMLCACTPRQSTPAPRTLTPTPPMPTAEIVEAILPQMALVEAGSFAMGSVDGLGDEQPVHTVQITRPFYIGTTKVTFEEYDRFCDDTPGVMRLDDQGWGRGDRPAFGVTWNDAVAYCNWLSEEEGLTPCYSGRGSATKCDFTANGYRLPTEAEWEYAARGGPDSAGYLYAGSDDPDDVAWYGCNSGGIVQPVGLKRPNELGLYDMSGNGWEWCWDRYDYRYYSTSPSTDPAGPASGDDRVRRAGGWNEAVQTLRTTFRSADKPSYAGSNGFRLVRTAEAVTDH